MEILNKTHSIGIFFALTVYTATVPRSFAFEVLESNTPIGDAAKYNDGIFFFSDGDAFLIDGEITSYPPDQKTYDRTFMSIARLGINSKISSQWSMRLILDGRYHIHKIHEETEPRRLLEEKWYESRPSIDIAYTTTAGIELNAGAKYWYINKYTRKTESVSFRAKTDYDAVSLFVPRLSVLKRTSDFVGGAYYQVGAEQIRGVHKEASDGTELDVEQIIYAPSEYGIYFKVDVATCTSDVEVSAVQASEGGPVADDASGETIYEDYLRARLGLLIPIDKNALNFYVGLAHQTLSYSDNAYMSLQTVPMSAAHLRVLQGSAEKHVYLGLIYAYAEDTQSLPEFNQKFKINVYGARFGLQWKF